MKAIRELSTFIVFLLVSTLVQVAPVSSAQAATGGMETWRLIVHGGGATRDLQGLRGASFEKVSGSYFAVAATKAFDWWHTGLQFSSLRDVSVNPFVLSSNATGSYKLSFTRVQWLNGIRADDFRFNLVMGLENADWNGSPDLGLKSSQNFHYGAMFSYDVLGDSRVRIPAVLTVLSHPERSFEFENAPSDSMTADAGTEISLGMGLSVDF